MRPARLVTTSCAACRRLARSRRGATAVEYGLIAALIVITMIASFKLVANQTIGTWTNVQAKIGNATGY